MNADRQFYARCSIEARTQQRPGQALWRGRWARSFTGEAFRMGPVKVVYVHA